MKRLGIALLAILVLLGSLIWQAPAWLLTDTLQDRLEGVELGAASGGLWQGRLSHVVVQGLQLDDINWRVQPSGLWNQRLLEVTTAAPVEVSAELGLLDEETLTASDVQARGQIAPLLDAADVPSMGFDGQFIARLEQAQLTAKGCSELQGKVSIDQLSGDVDGLDALGSIQSTLSCSGGQVVVNIDPNNPMKVRGNLRIAMNGMPRGQIQLSPPEGSALYNSLSQFFGKPRNGRDFVLRF